MFNEKTGCWCCCYNKINYNVALLYEKQGKYILYPLNLSVSVLTFWFNLLKKIASIYKLYLCPHKMFSIYLAILLVQTDALASSTYIKKGAFNISSASKCLGNKTNLDIGFAPLTWYFKAIFISCDFNWYSRTIKPVVCVLGNFWGLTSVLDWYGKILNLNGLSLAQYCIKLRNEN